VLVRGHSTAWAFADYGNKEAVAAQRIQEGQHLVIVASEEFRRLLELNRPARCLDHVAGKPIAWLVPPPSRESFESVARISGPLDREQTVKGRTEQGFLRNLLFPKKEAAYCSLCGEYLPSQLLVAAHIKPRSMCGSSERRDAENIVFALCLLGCDALYERGFVSVNEKGKIITVNDSSLPKALRLRLRTVKGLPCRAWNDANTHYFRWHECNRFLGS